MSYEHKENRGSIFPNDKKTKESHPGWKGSAKIGGVDYWVSGWVNKSATGAKHVSLAFEQKDEEYAPRAEGQPEEPFNDEMPF